MSKVSEISNYIQGINLEGKNPLEFLIEDDIRTNPYHKYVVRKIISQLSVEEHIHRLGPALKTEDTRAILRTNSKWTKSNINKKYD